MTSGRMTAVLPTLLRYTYTLVAPSIVLNPITSEVKYMVRSLSFVR